MIHRLICKSLLGLTALTFLTFLTSLSASAVSQTSVTALEPVLAFPGADGFGRYTIGGRGGTVYIVNSLEDDAKHPAPGTLRHAVETKEPRTIVFNVSGIIHLQDDLVVRNDFITIAGQSSPSGIVLRGAPFFINANQVIVRYMRFRLGLIDSNEDAAGGKRKRDIILDHCSFSWSIDEVASFYNNKNFTLQHSIIAQSLNSASHKKGDHGYGGIWGGAGASFIYNVIAHNISRNPRVAGHRLNPNYPVEQEFSEYRNNVVYNWGSNSAYGGEFGRFNFMDNMYIAGPATTAKRVFQFFVSSAEEDYGFGYFNGNKLLLNDGKILHDTVTIKAKKGKATPKVKEQLLPDALDISSFSELSFPGMVGPRRSADDSYRLLINQRNVGANRNAKGTFFDSVDKQILSDIAKRTAKHGKNGIINSELEVIASWDSYAQEFITDFEIVDFDSDGLPDSWENENSLSAANAYDLSDTYTNIEMYLSSIAKF